MEIGNNVIILKANIKCGSDVREEYEKELSKKIGKKVIILPDFIDYIKVD